MLVKRERIVSQGCLDFAAFLNGLIFHDQIDHQHDPWLKMSKIYWASFNVALYLFCVNVYGISYFSSNTNQRFDKIRRRSDRTI